MYIIIYWWQYLLIHITPSGIGLWCLTPLLTIFQLYRGGSDLLVEETGVPGETQNVSGNRH